MDSEMLFRQADEACKDGNFKRAFSLFLMAAEQGNALAMTRVAVMYEQGEGTLPDVSKSIEYDLKAIAAGSNTSVLNIALTYKNLGNVDEAVKWLRMALDRGDGEAAFELAKVCHLEDRNSPLIKKYLDLAANADELSESTSEEVQEWLACIATGGRGQAALIDTDMKRRIWPGK